MPKVFIIILNWNGLEDTLECLGAVFQLEYANFEVIVVDNGSSDGSCEAICSKFPQAVLIQNGKNLGFTGGNNIGMRYAMQHGADYVWLLNNDTVVETDSLSMLVYRAEQSPEIGLVSPAIYHYDSPDKVQYIGSYVDFKHFSNTNVENEKELDDPQVQRNLILWGTALLIKRKLVVDIGYLSEKYFAYLEDCDYSYRTLKANYQASVRLEASILHKGAQSTGMHSPVHVFLGMRNLFFLWKDHTQGVRKLFLPGYYIAMVINYAKCLLDEGNEKGFDACLNGFWAAFKGAGGEYDPTIIIPPWLKNLFHFLVSWHPYFWVHLLRFEILTIFRKVLVKTAL